MPHIVTIDASAEQLRKLKKGLPVRIKKGTGFNLIVHPGTYNIVTKAFAKNSGVQVELTPEEIEMNRALSPEQHAAIREANPEMSGQGIFGKRFDKLLHKAGVKKLAYKIGDELKPLAKAGITAGLTAGASALGGMQPELIPYLPAGVAGLSGLASDYLDRPGHYQDMVSGIRSKGVKNYAGEVAKAKANELLNRELGTNYDYMSKAGIGDAIQNELNNRMSTESVMARRHGSGFHRKSHGLIMSGRGTHVGGSFYPPALISQPLSANYQFKHTLPPQYQHEIGSGLGAGLGTGLYV